MSSRLTSESRIYADKARDLNRQVSFIKTKGFISLNFMKYSLKLAAVDFHLKVIMTSLDLNCLFEKSMLLNPPHRNLTVMFPPLQPV